MEIKDFYQRINDYKVDRRTLSFGRRELAYTLYKEPESPPVVIQTSQALATKWPGKHIYSGEEQFFYYNFLKYYRLSDRLFKQSEFREALLSLHLSTEMLLKHLLSKTAHFYFQSVKTIPTEFVDVMFKAHDISIISKPLMLAVLDIRTISLQDVQFEGNNMKNLLGKWQKVRYSNPLDTKRNSKCKNIYLSMRPKLKAFYKDIALHGTVKWT